MSHTPHHPEQDCPHERGVGTTVCLHCRREARIAAQIKRKRLMLRGSAAAIVVATALAATAVGATAIRGRTGAPSNDSAGTALGMSQTPGVAETSPAGPSAGTTVAIVDSGAQSTPVTESAHPTAPAEAKPPRAPLAPIIPPGQSPFANGVTAFRTDSLVTVSFDVSGVRTRFPDKFERFVRSTLPAVYGPDVDLLLAKVPVGALARQGNLLTELPSSGARIPAGDAWEIRVYPETRPGQDGPLVVRYRTVVCGSQDTSCGSR